MRLSIKEGQHLQLTVIKLNLKKWKKKMIHGKNIRITEIEKKKYIPCKNLLFTGLYTFAVWENDAENHLLMLFLKMSTDFVERFAHIHILQKCRSHLTTIWEKLNKRPNRLSASL